MPAAANPNDHRPRVAAERRERMRKRLLESAMIVFADKGVGASVIPEVVAAADVAKGSFYNYFRTNEDLLAALTEELSSEMVQLIEAAVGGIPDPVLRVATGMRCYLHLVRAYPLLARFLAASGQRLVDQHGAIFRYLPDDLKEGQKQGLFDAVPLDIMQDVIAGAALVAIGRIARGRTVKTYPDKVVAALLRSLGMHMDDADTATSGPLPKLAPAEESLLARAQARAAGQAAGGA